MRSPGLSNNNAATNACRSGKIQPSFRRCHLLLAWRSLINYAGRHVHPLLFIYFRELISKSASLCLCKQQGHDSRPARVSHLEDRCRLKLRYYENVPEERAVTCNFLAQTTIMGNHSKEGKNETHRTPSYSQQLQLVSEANYCI